MIVLQTRCTCINKISFFFWGRKAGKNSHCDFLGPLFFVFNSNTHHIWETGAIQWRSTVLGCLARWFLLDPVHDYCCLPRVFYSLDYYQVRILAVHGCYWEVITHSNVNPYFCPFLKATFCEIRSSVLKNMSGTCNGVLHCLSSLNGALLRCWTTTPKSPSSIPRVLWYSARVVSTTGQKERASLGSRCWEAMMVPSSSWKLQLVPLGRT